MMLLKRKWVKKYFIYSVVLLLLVGIGNFILDPLQQYRKAGFYKPHYVNSRFLNPGLIKNYDYDSVIIGSSMVQNFSLSDIRNDLKFKKPIKLTSSGMRANLMTFNIKTALKYKNINHVLLSLDAYAYSGNRNKFLQLEKITPLYLYDNNYLNDYQYLLNIDTIKYFIRTYVTQIMGRNLIEFSYDNMYQWQHRFDEKDFGTKPVITTWKKSKNKFNIAINIKDGVIDNLKRNFQDSISHVVANNPDIIFYMFFPPYSVLSYADLVNNKSFNDVLRFKEYISLELLKYHNVKLFAFDSEEKIITNLDNYRDEYHYHQNINKWMVDEMSKSNYLVTHENYKDSADKLNKTVLNYIDKNKL